MLSRNEPFSSKLPFLVGLQSCSLLIIIAYYYYPYIFVGGIQAVNILLFIGGFIHFRYFYIKDQEGLKIKLKYYYLRVFEQFFFPLLFMVICVGLYTILFDRALFTAIGGSGLTGLLFVNNFQQMFSSHPHFIPGVANSPLNHLWFVSLYFQMVILTPLLYKVFYSWNRRPVIAMNMLFILSILSAISMIYLYQKNYQINLVFYNLFTRLFTYTFGCALGLLFPSEMKFKPLTKRTKLIFNSISCVCMILILATVFFMDSTQAFTYRCGMILITIIISLFVLLSIYPDTFWNKVISSKFFTLIGKRLYTYFLWAYPIHVIMMQQNLLSKLAYPLVVLIQLVVTVLVSECSYRLIEQKSIQLPLGQDFNFRKSKHQVSIIRKQPKKNWKIIALSVTYIVVFAIGLPTIVVAAFTGDNQLFSNQIASRIKANEAVIEETKSKDREISKAINHIEGLASEELLYANGFDVTFVGDINLVLSANDMTILFPKAVIDGDVMRQLYNSNHTIKQLEQDGLLKENVVTILGMNGSFTDNQLKDYVKSIGVDRNIYFVTLGSTLSWTQEVNQRMIRFSQNQGNIRIIDWANYCKQHPEYYTEDGIHLSQEGSKAFSQYIAKEIYRQR